MRCSEKFGLAYVVSKMGLLFVYAVDNLAAVYRQRISADPVFLAQVRSFFFTRDWLELA